MRIFRNTRSGRRAYSLIEVLVSVAILMTGIVTILSFLPVVLRQNRRSADISIAAYLAQMKAEEIRRDNGYSGRLIEEIQTLSAATEPIEFAHDPRFQYQFSGRSLLLPEQDPGLARVIISYTAGGRPQDAILYELRFGD